MRVASPSSQFRRWKYLLIVITWLAFMAATFLTNVWLVQTLFGKAIGFHLEPLVTLVGLFFIVTLAYYSARKYQPIPWNNIWIVVGVLAIPVSLSFLSYSYPMLVIGVSAIAPIFACRFIDLRIVK